MLWELLADKSPWKQWHDLSHRGPAPLLSSVVPGAPSELDAICKRALSPRRTDRYSSAGEMLEILERFIERHGRRVTKHELGKLISNAFEQERAQRNDIVRKQLLAMREVRKHGGSSLAELPQTLESIAPEPTSVSVHPELYAGQARRRWRYALAVVACGAAFGAGMQLMKEPIATSHIVASGLSSSTRTVVETIRETTPKRVELYVVALPPEATISIDGMPVPSNPYSAGVDVDDVVHRVRVAAPGYQPAEHAVRYDKPIVLRVKLVPQAAPPRAPLPARTTDGRE